MSGFQPNFTRFQHKTFVEARRVKDEFNATVASFISRQHMERFAETALINVSSVRQEHYFLTAVLAWLLAFSNERSEREIAAVRNVLGNLGINPDMLANVATVTDPTMIVKEVIRSLCSGYDSFQEAPSQSLQRLTMPEGQGQLRQPPVPEPGPPDQLISEGVLWWGVEREEPQEHDVTDAQRTMPQPENIAMNLQPLPSLGELAPDEHPPNPPFGPRLPWKMDSWGIRYIVERFVVPGTRSPSAQWTRELERQNLRFQCPFSCANTRSLTIGKLLPNWGALRQHIRALHTRGAQLQIVNVEAKQYRLTIDGRTYS